MHRLILRVEFDEIIADEQEHVLTGACRVRGDVAELFDRLPDGLDVWHVLRVDQVACSR